MGLSLGAPKTIKLPNATLKIFPVTVAATPQYATGGELVDLKKYTSRDPTFVDCKNTAGFLLQWIRATSKIMLMYYDYNNAADGPAIEFTNATNYPAGLVSDTQVEIWAWYTNQ